MSNTQCLFRYCLTPINYSSPSTNCSTTPLSCSFLGLSSPKCLSLKTSWGCSDSKFQIGEGNSLVKTFWWKLEDVRCGRIRGVMGKELER